MKIFARFRFLIQNGNLSALFRFQVGQMLEMCAHHSLTVANKIFEEPFLMDILIDILPNSKKKKVEKNEKIEEIGVMRIFHALGRNGNQIARKIMETKKFEEHLVFALFR